MLWRKLLRDIWGNRGSYLACLVIVAIGLVIFTTFSIVSGNLKLSQDMFYREQNFADGFAELVLLPESALERLSRVEGIREISGRVVREVLVQHPERESVYLKLVSLDLSDPHRVNDIRLLEGWDLIDKEPNAIIDSQFFTANELEPADVIDIIAGGRLWELTVAGSGMSPEFTYLLRTQADMYPNPEQFGVAFLPLETMWTLFPDMRGRVNDLAFTLEPYAEYERVKERLEPELERYGLISLYPRDDQVSHVMLSEEINAIETMSGILPLVFLLIAALILYIMLKRLVEHQRGQVGILKALGYSNRQVLIHYLSYALLVGAVGGLLGGSLGILLANPFTALLLQFFNVPEVYEGFSLLYLLHGLFLSCAIFLAAGYQGSKHVLNLKPAEAMLPSSPVFSKKTLPEKIAFIQAMLSIQGKMALRNLLRNRGRSTFLFFGIMLSCAAVALTWSINELFYKMNFYQFEEVETYDAKITLLGPSTRRPTWHELANLSETARVEPIAEVPVTLTRHWRSESIVVIGVPHESILYNILDAEGRRVFPAGGRIILSERLADKLQVSTGDLLEIESPYRRERENTQKVEVCRVIPQYMGMNAYMELSALDETLGQGDFATAFLVNVAGGEESLRSLRNRYLESDVVAGIDSREERIAQSEELLEAFGSIIYVFVLVGVIICFAIIYSSSFIILSEREREIASMRVLGMTSEEVFSVIALEQWFVGFFAMLAGLPLAQFMQYVMAEEMSTDFYTLPSRLAGSSLVAALVITAFSIWFAQRFALKQVKKLTFVDVLKTRE